MKRVQYQWSQNSEPDLCTYTDFFSKTEHLCYHCGHRISVFTEAVLLQTERNEKFVLHKACAEQSCFEVDNLSSDG